jgi:class 3 adenylate cyclase/Tfp pilus assembly protein PilF
MTDGQLQLEVESLEALIQSGNDYSSAEKKGLELLEQLSCTEQLNNTLHQLICRTHLALSIALCQKGMDKQGLVYAQKAYTIAQALQDNYLISKTLANIGVVYKHLSEYATSLEYYQRALALEESLDNKSGMARLYGNIGIIYSTISDYAKALEYYNKAVELFEYLDCKKDIASAYGNIGIIYYTLSNYTKALEYYGRTLNIFEELQNKTGMANVNSTIGMVYHSLSEYEQAYEYYNRALKLYQELDNKKGIAANIGNIGSTYFSQLQYNQALEYYKRTLAIYQEMGNKSGIAHYTNAIGNIYRMLLDYSFSIEYLLHSLEIYTELNNKRGMATVTEDIGVLLGTPDFPDYDPIESEEYLLKALEMNQILGIKEKLYTSHKNIADLYENQKRWEESHAHLKQFYKIEKEVNSEETKKKAMLMEHQRKIDEAERDRQVKLARFQEREKILDNILPSQITERLIKGEQPIADRAENVSVFFSDIVGFTTLSQHISANELVSGLNTLFIQYDMLASKFGLEKIKTIGDAYMAVCGLPVAAIDHAIRMAQFALEIQQLFAVGVSIAGHKVNVRIGLHCGEVVAGVIGEHKFSYDLWGDAVNTASRMESHGEAGRIHVSGEFAQKLTENLTLRQAQYTAQTLTQGEGFSFPLGEGRDGVSFTFPLGEGRDGVLIPRGEIEIKGKGRMKTYFLEKI